MAHMQYMCAFRSMHPIRSIAKRARVDAPINLYCGLRMKCCKCWLIVMAFLTHLEA